MIQSLIYAAVIIVTLLVLGIIASRLYTRSSQEQAFVRTGLGGKKVVMSGGALVLPVFHEVVWVNRNTLRLAVSKTNEHSLMTQDRMRADVSAEFYVRVAQDADSIATAAQTLGDKTNNPESLKALVEGKFVDSLRSAAAAMTMAQLADRRAEFVQNVKHAVSEDLAKNGLELESVSLTGLNQTKAEYFDPNNAFDAEGLLKLTTEIQTRKKTRNDVEQDTSVLIEQKNLDATRQQQELTRQREEVTLATARQIAAMKAENDAETARTTAEGRQKAEQANLAADQNIAERRIETERAIAQAEAEKKKVVEMAQLDTDTSVKLKAQEQTIQISEKSKAEAAAKAAAAAARALAVKAEEAVTTAKEVEIANREKEVALVKADQAAREAAVSTIVEAESARTAAEHRAEALRRNAAGVRDAAELEAEAINFKGTAEAEALRKKNDAQNALSAAVLQQQLKMAFFAALPGIIEKAVAPLENIDSIRIADVSGLNGAGNGGNGAGVTSVDSNAGSLPNQVVNAALRHRVAGPLIDSLMKDAGLVGIGNMDSLLSAAGTAAGFPSLTSTVASADVAAGSTSDAVVNSDAGDSAAVVADETA